MSTTGSRTLRLLTLLQSRRYWAGADLAVRLDVSVRTLRRDVERLRDLGYPVDSAPGVAGGYELAPGAALPPLVLDDDEAVALALGLQQAAHGPVAGMAEASVSALTKVVQVMPTRLRRRVDALAAMTVPVTWEGAGADVDPAALTTIAQACRDTERLTFTYVAAGGEATERDVEPLRLVPVRRRWYLVAYDVERHDWRTFRLDRLREPRATGLRFRPRELPAADAAEYVRSRMESPSQPHVVEVLVHAGEAVVRERIGRWADVTPDGDERCRVRMTSDSLVWPLLALGAVEAEFTVVSPPELAAQVASWGARFSRATRSA